MQEGYAFEKGMMAPRSLKRLAKFDVSVSKSTKPEGRGDAQSPNPIESSLIYFSFGGITTPFGCLNYIHVILYIYILLHL